MAIAKLFVRPHTFEHGIGRFLLKESIAYVRGRGMLPVLDLRDNCFEQAFFEKFGFRALPAGDADVAPMLYAG